jgi:predicted AlkP superfamily phosphohydrolase/phosphomutase
MLPQRLQDQLLFLWYAGGRKWAGARAFAVPNNDSVGAIRISVKGRDLNGVVDPGDEYRRLCRDITEALYELNDPVSGRLVVKRVTCSHEVFSGPFLAQLPDLTVLWDQSFRWQALHSPRFGTLHLRQQDSRTGSHTPRGFVIMAGPGVAAGAELMGCSIYDIAPTVLETAGMPLPAALDGRPLLPQPAPVMS